MTNGIFSSSVSVPYFGISNFHCLSFLFCFFFGVYNPLGQLYGHDISRCNHIATGKNIIGPLIQVPEGVSARQSIPSQARHAPVST